MYALLNAFLILQFDICKQVILYKKKIKEYLYLSNLCSVVSYTTFTRKFFTQIRTYVGIESTYFMLINVYKF